MMMRLSSLLGITLLSTSFIVHAATWDSVTIDPRHLVDESIPVIAAPVDFNAYLVDESSVLLSWNPELFDGSDAVYFNIWDKHRLIATTTESQWRFEGIDRDFHYDFAVSAVTTDNVETRRSARIYYDLPQLDASLPDGWNQSLPPLENLKAEVLNEDSVALTWDIPPAYWSWVEPSDYRYDITMDYSGIAEVDEPRYIFSGLKDRGEVWIGVSARFDSTISARNPQRVLVDTSNAIGTISTGVTGFNSVSRLRAEIYSNTAAELFWEVGNADRSHVFINGKLIARIKEGHSLFIEDLPPGESVLVSVGEGWPYDPEPQFSYILTYDTPLMHVWLDMPGDPDPKPDTETPPVSGLSAQAYSKSAGEVFWDRADNPLTLYRVFLDNKLIVETDAVSWYFDELSADTAYTVGVVAIDPARPEDANASERVETSFVTFGGDDDRPKCQVQGLYSAVYSSTAAEVFWNREAAGTQYELFLNDEFLINTDATSWYFDDLLPGSEYHFTIAKIDANCMEMPSSVQFTMSSTSKTQSLRNTSFENSTISLGAIRLGNDN